MEQKSDKKTERCRMGVEGLDRILHGGLPPDRLYLIQGDPGVGKTTLALQFLLEGAKHGEIGLYISLSETKAEILEVAESHGWSLDKISLYELTTIEEHVRGDSESTFFHPSEVELNRTTEAIIAEIERVSPRRVVFDSLSEMRMLSDTPLRYRRHILQLKHFFAGRSCTVLLLDDRSANRPDLQVESIAHGVITLLRESPGYGISKRLLHVMKVRGSEFREGFHDIILKKGGMKIFPRLVAGESSTPFAREDFSSGISELDDLFGGGVGRGTSTMFMGPPGTGKSTLGILFTHEVVSKQEKALVFLFDETVGTYLDRAAKLGMDLKPYIQEGLLKVEKVNPAAMSPGEFAYYIEEAVKFHDTKMVIIDSINGYLTAMAGERDLTLQLHEMLSYLNTQGVMTLMMMAQQGLIGAMESVVDLTYLADMVVLFRYYESRGNVKQALSVIKKRTGNHERSIRDFSISVSGVKIGKPLKNFQGILTGNPVLLEPSSEAETSDSA